MDVKKELTDLQRKDLEDQLRDAQEQLEKAQGWATVEEAVEDAQEGVRLARLALGLPEEDPRLHALRESLDWLVQAAQEALEGVDEADDLEEGNWLDGLANADAMVEAGWRVIHDLFPQPVEDEVPNRE